ncbi:protein NIM1-INTERACTING 1-like [Aristolochia californica]|uniref:protein NIM1-INTERACTING 1-like n=1 Tax=Aristolochia californica TaxID=171875 RepID=UPI0035E3B114
MKRESSKRPARHEDEADEEEKMDRFYALLRRIRAAKDRLRADESSECKKKKLTEGKSPWVPSFELEDFTQEIDLKNPVIFWSPSKKIQKIEKDQSLDLNLSL